MVGPVLEAGVPLFSEVGDTDYFCSEILFGIDTRSGGIFII